MTAADIDSYLTTLDPAQRSALEGLRRSILRAVPEAEECISYQVPAFRVHGKVVAGFAAFKTHLSYLPFSGSVLPAVEETAAYGGTKSALHFQPEHPLPDELVRKLVAARLAEISPAPPPSSR